MIVSLVSDPFMRAVVRRGALPDEDVVWRDEDVRGALDRGFPRLAVWSECSVRTLEQARKEVGPDLPLLVISDDVLSSWTAARLAEGFALKRVDDHGRRLRQLMERTASRPFWVDGIFRDIAGVSGMGVPYPLRGFGRRVLEHPARYTDLHALARLSGVSRGALKARFRRRDLPSPYTYLRWFRILAAVHLLADGEMTTEAAAYRMGMGSSGNFCRFVQDMTGWSPSDLRGPMAKIRVVLQFVEECLERSRILEWSEMEDLFLEGVA